TNKSIFGFNNWDTAIVRNLKLKNITLTLTSPKDNSGVLFDDIRAGSIIENIIGDNITLTKNFNNGIASEFAGIITGFADDTSVLSNIHLANINIDLSTT